MTQYIRTRLRADAVHLIERAKAEQLIVHKGLRGRFRELLVDTMLTPWLPPYAVCATGMIVDVNDRARQSTQDDIVIFDLSLMPPILAHPAALEGVFPLDGVLARIEVKSKLTRAGIKDAVEAAAEIAQMNFGPPSTRSSMLPASSIFAFGSDQTSEPENELTRLLEVVQECGHYFSGACPEFPGPISALCIVGRGSWAYAKEESPTSKWVLARATEDHDELLHFIGVESNTCFSIHNDRTGYKLDPTRGAGGGIGNYILRANSFEVCDLPPRLMPRVIRDPESYGYSPDK